MILNLRRNSFPEIILITGAAGGIGGELFKLHLNRSSLIGIIDNDEEALNNLLENVTNKSSKIFKCVGDISNYGVMQKFIDDFISHADVDYRKFELYAVAGVAITQSSLNSESSNLALRNLNSNFLGHINIIALLDRYIRNRKGGTHLTFISSNSVLMPTRNNGEYAASKAALNAWVESLRIQYFKLDIRISLILPSFVLTNMTKNNQHYMPFIIKPDLAAKRIIEAKILRRKLTIIPKRAKAFSWILYIMPRSIYIRLLTILENLQSRN